MNNNFEIITNLLNDIKLELENKNKIIDDLSKENNKLKNQINNKIIFENSNIKSLNTFTNVYQFNEYTENLYNIHKWKIRSESYKDRAETIRNYSYWNTLKEQFKNKKLTHWNISDEQMVSFFDTMHLMYILLNSLKNDEIKNNTIIIQEYQIEALNKPRIDYLLAYRNNIILIEFSKSNNYNNLSKDASAKQQQLNGYENALRSSLENSNNIKIISIPIIYLNEEEENNIEHNQNTISMATKKINKIFLNDKNAFELLQNAE